MKADYFLFGNNQSPSKFGDFTGCFKVFALKQLIRIVLHVLLLLKEKYNVLECFESLHLLIIYIESHSHEFHVHFKIQIRQKKKSLQGVSKCKIWP